MSRAFLERSGLTIERARARYPHGTRARYVIARCRCIACADANTAYVKERDLAIRGPWRADGRGHGGKAVTVRNLITNEVDSVHRGRTARARATKRAEFLNERDHQPDPDQLVDATFARYAIERMKAKKIGTRTLALRSGIARSVILKIAAGQITRTRRDTVDAICSIELSPRGSTIVDARETWRLINDLLRRGWTRAWISRALGNRSRALQIGRSRITAKTAERVRALHTRLRGVEPHRNRTTPRPMNVRIAGSRVAA